MVTSTLGNWKTGDGISFVHSFVYVFTWQIWGCCFVRGPGVPYCWVSELSLSSSSKGGTGQHILPLGEFWSLKSFFVTHICSVSLPASHWFWSSLGEGHQHTSSPEQPLLACRWLGRRLLASSFQTNHTCAFNDSSQNEASGRVSFLGVLLVSLLI